MHRIKKGAAAKFLQQVTDCQKITSTKIFTAPRLGRDV
jgi:hypothetical protein